MGKKFTEIADDVNISTSTAYRTFAIFQRTGTVDPASRTGTREEMRKLNQDNELYIIGVILSNPSAYLGEIVQEIQRVTNVTVSIPTVCRLLKRYGLTPKKIRQVAKQRSDALRDMFMSHVLHFDTSMLVWVDESGSDRRACMRKYGYAIRGDTPVYSRSLYRGKRINAIAAMTSSEVLAVELHKGNVNGEVFYDFLRGTLIPRMQTFPNRNSVLIMDNCSIHHIQDVKKLLKDYGVVLLFLSPYSPDYNPLEESFSFVKSYLRKHDELNT